MEGIDAQTPIKSSDSRFCLDESSERALVNKQMPFKTRLSLLPLIERWDRHLNALPAGQMASFDPAFLTEIRKLKEFSGPVEHARVFSPYREQVKTLASLLMPTATWDSDLRAIVGVFDATPILASPGYERIIPNSEALPKANVDPQLEFNLTLLYGYSMILNRLYGLNLEVDYPIIRNTIDPDTGFPIYFQVEVDTQFVEITANGGKLPPLSQENRERIERNPTDLDLLAELLPPDRFEFTGFVSIHALNVTDHSLLSGINQQLIETRSIVCPETISELQDRLRSLFRSQNLELGLAAFQEKEVLLLHSAVTGQQSCIVGDSLHLSVEKFSGSAHEKAGETMKTIIVEDLQEKGQLAEVEKDLLSSGVRNLAVAPLVHEGRVVGMIELKSPELGTLNPMNCMKLRELLPSFTSAMLRSLKEFESRVDSVIKRECTVIHQSVEWRFREAAALYLSRGGTDAFGNEAIAFKDVYPLYAASDIRNSSGLRNRSISQDLNKELDAVREILQQVPNHETVPILAQAIMTCHSYLELTRKEVRANDEYRITEFLQTEIREILRLLADRQAEIREKVQEHLDRLDPHHQTIFENRKAYMDSVAQLNDAFGNLLEQAQEKAQKIYPHYFEKHSTDGVDFTMYIGESLCRSQPFHPLYLDNLRLWQLILMCDLACVTHQLKGQLPVPLDTTHLVAVQDHPVSIRFRFDERLFDVDGAYNARYEIMKKRIDKAMVKGRSERLTQPDKIAIVYSSAPEAAKYRKHIDYLQATGYLIPGFEDLQLEDLQGVEGLRAMRVTVNLDRQPNETPTDSPGHENVSAKVVW